jgi:tRNA (cytidine56-2'-O)-methyltransferase
MTKEIRIIRIGHRIVRDVRVTTHCALAARALGANGIIITGEEDQGLIEGLKETAKRWGGKFYITYSPSWHSACSAAKKEKFVLVHSTMYGQPIQKVVGALRKERKLAIIVGSQKVPGEVYRMADYNVAVTNQPHSEVAALAIILHELFKGKELSRKFVGAKIRVLPSKSGKKVIKSH